MHQRPAPTITCSHIILLSCTAFVLWFSLAAAPANAQGAPPCPGNINGDMVVDVNDLLVVIGAWGACPQPCPPSCAADIAPPSGGGGGGAGDCTVDVNDLLAVIGAWGPCPTCPAGQTWCFGSCRDLANDPTFCGTTCENAVLCGQFETCTGGVCVPVEPPLPPR